MVIPTKFAQSTAAWRSSGRCTTVDYAPGQMRIVLKEIWTVINAYVHEEEKFRELT